MVDVCGKESEAWNCLQALEAQLLGVHSGVTKPEAAAIWTSKRSLETLSTGTASRYLLKVLVHGKIRVALGTCTWAWVAIMY